MVLGSVKRILTNVFRIALTARDQPDFAIDSFQKILDDLEHMEGHVSAENGCDDFGIDSKTATAIEAHLNSSSISGNSASSRANDVEHPVPANSPAGPIVTTATSMEDTIELRVEEAPTTTTSVSVEDAAVVAMTTTTEPVNQLVDADTDADDEAQAETDEEPQLSDEESDAEADVDEETDDSASESDSYLERLEVVRIKKVLYWKDSETGDLYVYMPEDEVGDKIGRVVDGKAVMNE